jgi:hypothetical protein
LVSPPGCHETGAAESTNKCLSLVHADRGRYGKRCCCGHALTRRFAPASPRGRGDLRVPALVFGRVAVLGEAHATLTSPLSQRERVRVRAYPRGS